MRSPLFAILLSLFAATAGATTPPPPDLLSFCDQGDTACEQQATAKLRTQLEADFAALPDLRPIISPEGTYALSKAVAPTSPVQGYGFVWRVFEELRRDHWFTRASFKSLTWHDQLGMVEGKATLQAYYPSDLLLVTTVRQGKTSEDFFTLGGLLRITDYKDGYRTRLRADVRADKMPITESQRFALRTNRPELSDTGARFEEDSLKVCRYSRTSTAQAHLASGSGDIRFYYCEEVRTRTYADGRAERFRRSSHIGYFSDYDLFLEVLVDASGRGPRQGITALGDAPPDDSNYPDWLKGNPTP